MMEDEKFASVLVSDLHKSNEETLRLRGRIAVLEDILERACYFVDDEWLDDALRILKKGEANDGG